MRKYTQYCILLILNLLIAVSIFGIYFLYQKVQNALNSQERIKLEQEIQTQQIKNLPQIANQYQAILENEHYFSLLYSQDAVVDIIKNMEQLAKDQQITLSITQKELLQKKKGVTQKKGEEEKEEEKPKELSETLPYEKSIRLELKATGKYIAIRNFLHLLETAPYALDVLSVQGTLAPPEDTLVPTARPQNDNPFLLSGPQPGSQGEGAAPASTDALFLIEVALYIQ